MVDVFGPGPDVRRLGPPLALSAEPGRPPARAEPEREPAREPTGVERYDAVPGVLVFDIGVAAEGVDELGRSRSSTRLSEATERP